MTKLPLFSCNKCGACCRLAGRTPEMQHMDRGDGACLHLRDDNTCAIYETRPMVCRVDEGRPKNIPATEWIAQNERACEQLRTLVYGGES